MNTRTVLTGLFILTGSAGIIHAQTSLTTEQRIRDLERRVTMLEYQLKQSSLPMGRQSLQDESPATAYESGGTVYDSQNTPYTPSVVRPEQPSAITRDPNGILTLRLIRKKIEKAGPGEEFDQFAFLFEFTNIGKKDITAIKSDIRIRSTSGETLMLFSMESASYLSVHDRITWYGGVPYDPENPNHIALLQKPLEGIEVSLELRQLVFADGSIKDFKD